MNLFFFIFRISALLLLLIGSLQMEEWVRSLKFSTSVEWRRPADSTFSAIRFNTYSFYDSQYASGMLISASSDEDLMISDDCQQAEKECVQNGLTAEALLSESAPPLLDRLLPDGDINVREQVMKHQNSATERVSEYSRYNTRRKLNVTHLITNDNGQLNISARFLGSTSGLACHVSGHCIVTTYIDGNKAFYSEDGGLHWQWLSHFTVPDGLKYFSQWVRFSLLDNGRLVGMYDKSLYVSDDLGEKWIKLLDLNSVLPEQGIDITGDNSEAYSWSGRDKPNWAITDAGHLTLWLNVSRYQPMKSYRKNGYYEYQTLRIQADLNKKSVSDVRWINGVVSSVISTTEGTSYVIFEQPPRGYFSLNRLKADGTYETLLESGPNKLHNLYADKDILVIEKGIGSNAHTLISKDSGKNWYAVKQLMDDSETYLDAENSRMIRFSNTSGRPLGNKSGVAYQEATF